MLRTKQAMETLSQSIRPHKPEQEDVSSHNFALVLCTHNEDLFMEPGQQRKVICIDLPISEHHEDNHLPCFDCLWPRAAGR